MYHNSCFVSLRKIDVVTRSIRTFLEVMVTGLALLSPPVFAQNAIVIQNVSIIDGTGSAIRPNASVFIEDGKIILIEYSAIVALPEDALVINGKGKYLLPGFIDSNVHASIYGNSKRRETVVKYGERNDELVLEFAQRLLKYGITTARDSYGALVPLMEVRDRINSGDAVGSRLLVAGNIVGWGGPFSLTFSLMSESDLTLFQATWNDWIAQGVGEELMDMGPEEVRVAINSYLDKGPDFVKYGGTSHFLRPSLIGFSPRVQKVIVDETHKRGLIAETHSTSPEALRMSVEAGIDLIQHPEILSRDYPDELLEMIVQRDVICALRSNTLTGKPWQQHLQDKKSVEAELSTAAAPRTTAERRQREERLNLGYEIQRRNAERLIQAGCRVTIATDSYQGQAPEFRMEPKPDIDEAGTGSILAIEGLVELGMTEMEALVAATRNGAMAAGMLETIGTIEVGKNADLLILRENPLDDISNIRSIERVFSRGKAVNSDALPEKAIFYLGPIVTADRMQTSHAANPVVVTKGLEGETSAVASQRLQSDRPASADEFGEGLIVLNINRAPHGNLIVELENGQRWRQLDSDNTQIVIPTTTSALTANVKQSIFGSVSMAINGSGRPFKVSRINE